MKKKAPLTESTAYILLALIEPAHGYLIIQKVKEFSNETIILAPGTLYGALENLKKQKLINYIPNEDSRRKVYIITDLGLEILNNDIVRQQKFIAVAQNILQ